MGPRLGRDGPGEAPAVAVEHRQRPEIDRVHLHAPDQAVAESVQVGAAVVVDDAYRVAGGPAGVVQGDRVPLVGRARAAVPGVAGGEEALVVGLAEPLPDRPLEIGRASWRERVWSYV